VVGLVRSLLERQEEFAHGPPARNFDGPDPGAARSIPLPKQLTPRPPPTLWSQLNPVHQHTMAEIVAELMLVELCGLFGTLIADGERLYDPSAYHDRLLLGLKGAMSEALCGGRHNTQLSWI
jgi:hypothetical protein